jgi:hypothetical protein
MAELESLGEFILWQATSLRRTLRRIRDPLPFTVEFLRVVNKFIDDQAEHIRRFKAASGDADEWRKTWTGEGPDPHPVRRPDGTIPSRPSDCTAALGACSCRYCIHDPRVLKLDELHHFLPDTACPACGTDSTAGCVAEYPDG